MVRRQRFYPRVIAKPTQDSVKAPPWFLVWYGVTKLNWSNLTPKEPSVERPRMVVRTLHKWWQASRQNAIRGVRVIFLGVV